MHWWDWFNTAAGAASLMGLVLAAILGLVSWRISRATDSLIKSTSEGTQTLISQTTANTLQTLERMDQHWQQAWERMDQQANQRQREMMEAIQALKR